MARKGIHSSDAKRYVRIAQFAGVGLGVLAAALWVMDVPGLGRALPTKPKAESRPGLGSTSPVVMPVVRLDPEAPLAIHDRLEQALRRAKPAELPKPDDSQQQPDQPPPSGPAWRYLGAIREATRTLALVSIDGTQKIVGEGAVVKIVTDAAEGRPESTTYQATVGAVQPEYIEIQEGKGKSRRIELEARMSKVSWVKNMSVASAGAPIASAPGLSAEARQRLVAQGIDPAAAERARLAAMGVSQGGGRNRANPSQPQAGTTITPPGATTTIVGGRVVTAPADEVVPMSNRPGSKSVGDRAARRVGETQN